MLVAKIGAAEIGVLLVAAVIVLGLLVGVVALGVRLGSRRGRPDS